MPNVGPTPRRRQKVDANDLVAHLTSTIADFIKQNRAMKRQIARFTAGGSAASSTTINRALRTLQNWVNRALTTGLRRRRVSANGRRKANRSRSKSRL